MTYFGFLGRFLLIPIIILIIFLWLDRRRRVQLPAAWQQWSGWLALLIHISIAVIYTTPWDNYLVATRVWWYDPQLVTGFTIGWVPIEEYTFFGVQPVMTGLWLLWLLPRLSSPARLLVSASPARMPMSTSTIRRTSTAVIGLLWLASLVILLIGWQPGTYLGLELIWALPPVALQLGFGADILWHHRRLVLAAIVPTTLYLSLADAVAIDLGTWTINPQQSLQVLLGGVLPLEEAIFFFLTNTLLVFGLVLFLAPESQTRLAGLRQMLNPQPATRNM